MNKLRQGCLLSLISAILCATFGAGSATAQTSLYLEEFTGVNPQNTGFVSNGAWFLPTGGTGENNDASCDSYAAATGPSSTNPFGSGEALLLGIGGDTIQADNRTGLYLGQDTLMTLHIDWAAVAPPSNPTAESVRFRLRRLPGGDIDLAARQGSDPLGAGVFSDSIEFPDAINYAGALYVQFYRSAPMEIWVDRLEITETLLADMAVLVDGPLAADAGDSLTYTIDVSNNYVNTAENVIVDLELPAGLSVETVSYAACNNTLPCNLGDFDGGNRVESITVTVLASLSITESADFAVTATVSSDTREEGSGVRDNDSASVTTAITGAPVTVDPGGEEGEGGSSASAEPVPTIGGVGLLAMIASLGLFLLQRLPARPGR